VGIHYAVHAQVGFSMPLDVGDPLYSYETAVAVNTPVILLLRDSVKSPFGFFGEVAAW
jgi:hypothetical protein